MENSTSVDVPCNGPCRKRSRAITADQAIGLCPECHQQATNRHEPNLPPELWIEIFRYLDNNSKLRARATCRHWRDIVDKNRSLRKEFRVTFERRITMDDRFQPENLLPASRASLREIRIILVDDWWPRLGADLTNLELLRCEIALPVFIRMLKETPNLTRLILGNIEYTSTQEIEVNFVLDKLDYLSCDRVFEVFGHIFSRLKKLDLGYQPNDDQEARACRFLRLVQDSLEDLECRLTPLMLEQMVTMNRLQLKTVVDHGTSNMAVYLSRIQGTIEDLSVTATNKDLCKIGRNLTKLRKVAVILKDARAVVPSFLAEMPHLTSLHLEGVGCEDLIFQRLTSANLRNLRLDSFNFAGGSLRRFLTNCSKLQELEVQDCSLDSWSDIFAALSNSLRCLKLRHNLVEQNDLNVSGELHNLKELVLFDCNISTEMLVELLLQCPRLEKLSLCLMKTINDQFVGILCQFPLLRKLELKSCAITDKVVKLIVENCSHLIVHIDPR